MVSVYIYSVICRIFGIGFEITEVEMWRSTPAVSSISTEASANIIGHSILAEDSSYAPGH